MDSPRLALVIVPLLGWPGAILATLVAVEVVERRLHRVLTVSWQWKLAIGGAALMLGVLASHRSLSAPLETAGAVQTEMEQRHADLQREKQAAPVLDAQAAALRRDLEKQSGS